MNDQSLDQKIKQTELDIKKAELRELKKPFWLNSGSIVPAIIIAVLGIWGNLVLAIIDKNTRLLINEKESETSIVLEEKKFQTSLILDAIKTNDQTIAKDNLRFLIETGFISDPNGSIKRVLNEVAIPVLPASPGDRISYDFSYAKTSSTHYPRAQSFKLTKSVRIEFVDIDMGEDYAKPWSLYILNKLPISAGERGLIDISDLKAHALCTGEVKKSQKGWVRVLFKNPATLEKDKKYFIFINSSKLGDGPDSHWAQSESGQGEGPYKMGEGWVFVYSWSDNSNYRPSFGEKKFDYSFKINGINPNDL